MFTIRYKIVIVSFSIATLMSSCMGLATKVSSAKTIDIDASVTAKPGLADLDVKENKVKGSFFDKVAINIESTKREAVAMALRTVNADIMVEPQFTITTANGVNTVEVTGYPAYFKNFRALKNDDLLLFDALNGVKNSASAAPQVLLNGATIVNPIIRK